MGLLDIVISLLNVGHLFVERIKSTMRSEHEVAVVLVTSFEKSKC